MRYSLLVLVLFAAACVRIPDSYAPPMQRKPLSGEIANVRHWVNMNDPDAPEYFVADISENLEAGAWRWTRKRPALKFVLETTQNLKFVVEFTIAEILFQHTGPVTISFSVNGRLLGKERYDTPGHKRFEAPVQSEWLKAGEETLAAAEIDKVWTSPRDGEKLGFILTRAGFLD